MKNISTKYILLFIVVLIFYGCEKEDESIENEKITIDLIANDELVSFAKTMVIFEDEEYLVKSPLQIFIGGLGNYYFDDYSEFLNTIDRISKDASTVDLLLAKDYFAQEQMDHLLAHFLESGNCLIYDKAADKIILEIEMEQYHCAAPLAGSGGRRFYIDNKLFFELIDYIC